MMPNRRDAVPFDADYFRRRAEAGEEMPALAAFRHAYERNHWAGDESVSGPGASADQTEVIRRRLPEICSRLRVRTLLDLPCGDFSWMSLVDLADVRYIGGDLLPELIEENSRRYARQGREFRVVDLLESPLPQADIVLCRDCLVHFSFSDVARASNNLRRSGITWLLTTTFPAQSWNEDIHTGDWRPINLERAPFDWPTPVELLNERCTEGGGQFADKSLGLWRVSDIPAGLAEG